MFTAVMDTEDSVDRRQKEMPLAHFHFCHHKEQTGALVTLWEEEEGNATFPLSLTGPGEADVSWGSKQGYT